MILQLSTVKCCGGAAGSTGLYIGLQRAFLCSLSQYATNCWEKQRIQALDFVSLSTGRVWILGGGEGGKQINKRKKKKLEETNWDLQLKP